MQSRRGIRLVAWLVAGGLLVACSGAPEPPPAPVSSRSADVAAPVPVPTDEASLRRAASTALAEQRIYAPVGANAIEHYLALRSLRPDDGGLATALLELLPYAVIGSEQAMERGDLDEARRLVALVEQVDPQFPALGRLRDRIAGAELLAAQRAALGAEAEAEAQRQQQALLDARRDAATAPVVASESVSRALPVPPVAAPAPATLPVATGAATAAPVTGAPAGTPATAAPPPTTVIPRLLSAPSPRYPPLALRRQLEGEVTLQFTIQPDGRVTDPRVVSSNPSGVFDEAALVATRRWQFEASPRSVQSTRVIHFRLGSAQR